MLGGALLLGCSSVRAEPVDARAVTECTGRGGSFVAIEQCLPGAAIGLAVLDAFDREFGQPGAPLKLKCLEINKQQTGHASVCVREALKSALQLRAALPAGTTVPHPLFAVLADATKIEAVNAAGPNAQTRVPNWLGVQTYMPYR
jgi:hypothetical protein